MGSSVDTVFPAFIRSTTKDLVLDDGALLVPLTI